MAVAGRTDRPLIPVLLHQTFIVLTYLELPPYFITGRLPYTSQGSVLGGVRLYNPNGIKHRYIIRILPVAVAVPLIPVLDVITVVLLVIISSVPGLPDAAVAVFMLAIFVFGDGFC